LHIKWYDTISKDFREKIKQHVVQYQYFVRSWGYVSLPIMPMTLFILQIDFAPTYLAVTGGDKNKE
jgi:hypothetical protein